MHLKWLFFFVSWPKHFEFLQIHGLNLFESIHSHKITRQNNLRKHLHKTSLHHADGQPVSGTLTERQILWRSGLHDAGL